MTIIDDYSTKLWVKILKEKSEAFSFFKEWQLQVEREKGVSLKCLRTDNGLEFLSAEFEGFCKMKGIKRHKTAPRNPQQNGVAERMNRSILERVRCMLLSSGMPKCFWGEAVLTASKLINKSPSSAIDNQTPDSRWYGRESDYSTLRPFGCRAYAHVKQGKLDSRAIKCVFLGYQDGVKGFRLWCPTAEGQKLIISRDVYFDETQMPFLSKEKDGTRFEVEPHVEQNDSSIGTQSDEEDVDETEERVTNVNNSNACTLHTRTRTSTTRGHIMIIIKW